MQLQDVMSPSVETISQESSIAEAAQLMRQKDIGFLPVLGGTQLTGVVTDRDIAIRGVAAGKDPQSISVADVMTSDVQTVQRDVSVEEAANRMKNNQIHRLLVIDSDGRFEGVVTLGDLARRCHDEHLTGDTLEHIAQPVMQVG